jgi:ribonuclease BN (tRNA processing enzyme)
MRLLFLGTGGYHPNERRHTAGILIPELGIMFDAGTCAFRVPSRLSTKVLDIFLTHPHLDHIIGLTYLLVPMALKQIDTCRIHALPATFDAVKQHLFSLPLFPVLPPFDFVPLTQQVDIAAGRGKLIHHPLQHPGGSLGFLLQIDGKRIAYITDTTVDGSYTDFVRGSDVLIHECYFPDNLSDWALKTGHSHTSPVAMLARDAGVKRLYLTHIDPQRSDDDPIDIATARAIFPETYVAEDLMEVDV